MSEPNLSLELADIDNALLHAHNFSKSVIHFSDFYDGSGFADDALEAALNAVQDGQTLLFGPGTYPIDRNHEYEFPDKSFKVSGYGAVIEYQKGDIGLQIGPGWSEIQTFTALDEDGVTVLGIPDTSNFRVKDFVRLYSDDVSPSTFEPNSYQAEDIYIESKTENSVTLFNTSLSKTGMLAAFSNNPRIAQRNDQTIIVEGLEFRQSFGSTVSNSYRSDFLLRLTEYSRPIMVDVDFPYSLNPSAEVRACLFARVIRGMDGNHEDYSYPGDPSEARGYGIMDSSYGTLIFGRVGYRLRHFLDTHPQAYGSQVNPSMYGTAVNGRAIGCVGSGCTNATFSTHHGVINHKFISCDAIDGYDYGFGFRSEVEAINCSSTRCRGDWHAFDQDPNSVVGRTNAVIRSHTSVASGPSRNALRQTRVHVYDYTARDTVYDATTLLKQNHPEGVTQFHGTTTIRPSKLIDAGQTLFGGSTRGTIIFDYAELDLTSGFVTPQGSATYPRVFDIRGDETSSGGTNTANNFNLHGKLLRVLGGNARTLFNVNTGAPIKPGQAKFKVAFDPGVLVDTGGAQNNSTNTLFIRNEDSDYASSVLVVDSEDINNVINPKRKIEATVDFGNPTTNSLIVADVPAFGLNLGASYEVTVPRIVGAQGLGIMRAHIVAKDSIRLEAFYSGPGEDLSSVELTLNVDLT